MMDPIMPGMSDREKLQTLIQAHKVLRAEGNMDTTSYTLAEEVSKLARKVLDRILASHLK